MNSKINFGEIQKTKIRQIEDILQEYLPRQRGYQKVIMEAMAYSLLAGGKRLRPMMMKETFDLFQGRSKGDECRFPGGYSSGKIGRAHV